MFDFIEILLVNKYICKYYVEVTLTDESRNDNIFKMTTIT